MIILITEKIDLYRDNRTRKSRVHRVAVISYKDSTTETIGPIYTITRHQSNILLKYQQENDAIKVIKAEGVKGIVVQGEMWVVSGDEINPSEQLKEHA